MELLDQIAGAFDFDVRVEDWGRCKDVAITGEIHDVFRYFIGFGKPCSVWVIAIVDCDVLETMPGDFDDNVFSELEPFIEGLKQAVQDRNGLSTVSNEK